MPLKKTVGTSPYDLADYLVDADDVRFLIAEAFEGGDPAIIPKALGAAARSKGMVAIAKETGLTRESLYKALSVTGNPEFKTVIKVMAALGLRLVPHTGGASRGVDSRIDAAAAAKAETVGIVDEPDRHAPKPAMKQRPVKTGTGLIETGVKPASLRRPRNQTAG